MTPADLTPTALPEGGYGTNPITPPTVEQWTADRDIFVDRGYLGGGPAVTDHKAEAERLLEAAGTDTDKESTAIRREAQVHATLHLAEQTAALVEQHRISNLFSLAVLPGVTHPKYPQYNTENPPDDLYLIDDPTIREGLGL